MPVLAGRDQLLEEATHRPPVVKPHGAGAHPVADVDPDAAVRQRPEEVLVGPVVADAESEHFGWSVGEHAPPSLTGCPHVVERRGTTAVGDLVEGAREVVEHGLTQPAAADTIKVGILHSLSGTMAISETTLKDVMLMLIEQQNAKGGLLGMQLEAVVVDPASDWPLFAERARELIEVEGVSAVFGCWTSVSRKSVLPVFEELNNILFYPVQYEGEEEARNIFYTGAAPNQQAIPAVDYLMKEEKVQRWVLEGTDYVYPRTTNKILEAYLKSKGVKAEDIMINYTPFGHSDWQARVAAIKRFGSAGKKTAVVSTINGDANVPFYKELGNQKISAEDIPWPSVCTSTLGGANSGKTSTGMLRNRATPKYTSATAPASTTNRNFRLDATIHFIMAGGPPQESAAHIRLMANLELGAEQLRPSHGDHLGPDRRPVRQHGQLSLDVVDRDAVANEGQGLRAGVHPGLPLGVVQHGAVGDHLPRRRRPPHLRQAHFGRLDVQPLGRTRGQRHPVKIGPVDRLHMRGLHLVRLHRGGLARRERAHTGDERDYQDPRVSVRHRCLNGLWV